MALLHPLVVHPQHLRIAGRVAHGPMFVLLVATLARSGTAPRILAILPVLCARKLAAIPDLVVLLLPLIMHPQHILVAGAVARGPMFILHEAMLARIVATPRIHAIIPCICAGELAARPVVRVGTGRPALCPMLVLLVARAGGIAAAAACAAIFVVGGASGGRGEDFAIPHLLGLLLPTVVALACPLHVAFAGLVARRPVLVLLEARHARLAAAFALPAVLSIRGALGWHWAGGALVIRQRDPLLHTTIPLALCALLALATRTIAVIVALRLEAAVELAVPSAVGALLSLATTSATIGAVVVHVCIAVARWRGRNWRRSWRSDWRSDWRRSW